MLAAAASQNLPTAAAGGVDRQTLSRGPEKFASKAYFTTSVVSNWISNLFVFFFCL